MKLITSEMEAETEKWDAMQFAVAPSLSRPLSSSAVTALPASLPMTAMPSVVAPPNSVLPSVPEAAMPSSVDQATSGNDVVRRAKAMSSLAFSMYLFTRGEGPLRTTQDLFSQAEHFADEANRLYRVVKDFAVHVPVGPARTELLANLDGVPIMVQQLLSSLKQPTVGKPATFNKVDSVIQDTKHLMNAIAKVVTTCFMCASKVSLSTCHIVTR